MTSRSLCHEYRGAFPGYTYHDLWTDEPTVGGLPWCYRKQALAQMREPVGRTLGVRINHLPFGLQVYQALGMAPSRLPGHPHESLLRTRGCDLPLTLLDKSYKGPDHAAFLV